MKNNQPVSEGKQTIYLAAGKIIALMANFVIPLFLTRVLAKEEYGFYSQFNTVLFFLVSFFSFTMSTNLYYFFPTVETSKKKIIVFQTILFLIIFSLLSAFFIYLPYINDFILGNESLKKYRLIIYLLTIILIFTSIIQPLYVVKRDINISLWFPTLQIVLKAVLIIVFFIFIPDINSVINAIIVSAILVMLIVFRYVKKTINEFPGERLINKKIAISQLRYNLPIGLALSIKSFSQRFDKLISISFLSVSSYASYSIAFFGIPGIRQIYQSIADVTVVSMTKSFNIGDKSEVLSLYKRMVIKNLSFSIPVIMIVALNARQIINFLFTNKYTDATILFQMYLISIVFVMLGEGLIVRASGETKIYARVFIFTAPIIVPTTYFLVKYFGSIGAMCGALLSIILPRIFLIGKEIKIIESNLKNFFPWRKIGLIFLISSLSLIPFVFIKQIISDNFLIIIVMSIFYLLLVYQLELKLNIFIIDKKKILVLRKRYLKF